MYVEKETENKETQSMVLTMETFTDDISEVGWEYQPE